MRRRCLRFFRDEIEIQHSDPYLDYVDSVSITFEWQKKDERNYTVMHLALEHIILFLVRQWAALVKRIRKYPGSMGDTPISVVRKKNEHVTSATMVAALRDAVCAIRKDKLGFKA